MKTNRWSKIVNVLVVLLLLQGTFLATVKPAAAQTEYAWVAYNDSKDPYPNPVGNITTYNIPASGTTTGTLKKYSDGSDTGVTATFTVSGSITLTTNGGNVNAGTDAYETFNGKVNLAGVAMGTSEGWWTDLTFTNLDPNKTYTFATTANRNDSANSTRQSTYTISGMVTATNASTPGVTVISNESVSFSTGYNTVNGYVARWTGIQPSAEGSFKVRATNAGSVVNGYGQMVFMLAEEIPPSTPTITTVATLSSFLTPIGTPSAAQSYTVSGTNLTDEIVITPPNGFEISLMETSGFTTTPINLTPSSGTVTDTTIWVRLTGAAGSFSGNITHTSTGADQKDVPVSGAAVAYYTLSASIDGHGSVSLNPPGGSYPSGTVVTLTAEPNSGYAFDHWSGDLSGSDNPATLTMDAAKSVTAHFASVSCVTTSLAVAADTYMNSGTTKGNYNYGGAPTVQLNPFYQAGGSDQYRAPLLRWDLSGIPAEATVTDASLSFYVTTGESAYTYSLYQLRRAWVEGTSNDQSSTNSATWNKYDGVNNWGTAGAANTTSDRYDTNLWNAVASDFAGTGLQTFPLNAAGVDVVQSWLENPASNFGLTIQNYSGTSTGSWIAASRENTSGYQHPTLNVTYCVSTNPIISTSGTLAPFTTLPNVASESQSYTVSGLNLTEDLVITAPTGFQISLSSGSGYSSTLSLTPTDGVVPSTTIYVRLLSANTGTYAGNITHTSAGAEQKNVAVEGTVSNQICYDVSLEATEDNYLSAANVLYNNGGSTNVRVDNTTGTSRRTGLFKWDVSSIPSSAVIQTASLKLNVTETSSLVFNLYNMRRAWVEGTSDRANSSDSSNWNTYDGVNSWGTGGAASTETDRYDDNLWSADATSFTSNGSKTLPLNSSGVAVVQGWVSGSLPNYGLTMQNFTGSTADAVQFDSSEATTAANRPKLLVNYCVGNVVTYTLTVETDGHGTVNLSPSGNTYSENQVVTLTPVPNSGYQFTHWSGTNAADIIDTAGVYTIVMNGDKTVYANFSQAPDAPVLLQPADGSTNVGVPPTLQASVSDPDGDTMNVSFYGRPVSSQAPAEDFLFITVPDTQNLSQYNNTALQAEFTWIANRFTPSSDEPDLVFVTHVGDLVNTATDATQWGNIDAAFDKLDAVGVPYSVGPGNHDTGGSYGTYFGSSRFTGKSWYQGYYTGGTDNFNSYSFFSAGGMDFIVINLQYQVTSGALDWADNLLKTYSSRRGIVVQHDILNLDNSWNNQAAYTALSDNPNLFLMLCGHMHSSSDGSAYRLETRTGMNPVHVLLTDYQDTIGGSYPDYIRLLTFKPSTDQIYAQVFSPAAPGGYLTSESNYE